MVQFTVKRLAIKRRVLYDGAAPGSVRCKPRTSIRFSICTSVRWGALRTSVRWRTTKEFLRGLLGTCLKKCATKEQQNPGPTTSDRSVVKRKGKSKVELSLIISMFVIWSYSKLWFRLFDLRINLLCLEVLKFKDHLHFIRTIVNLKSSKFLNQLNFENFQRPSFPAKNHRRITAESPNRHEDEQSAQELQPEAEQPWEACDAVENDLQTVEGELRREDREEAPECEQARTRAHPATERDVRTVEIEVQEGCHQAGGASAVQTVHQVLA